MTPPSDIRSYTHGGKRIWRVAPFKTTSTASAAHATVAAPSDEESTHVNKKRRKKLPSSLPPSSRASSHAKCYEKGEFDDWEVTSYPGLVSSGESTGVGGSDDCTVARGYIAKETLNFRSLLLTPSVFPPGARVVEFGPSTGEASLLVWKTLGVPSGGKGRWLGVEVGKDCRDKLRGMGGDCIDGDALRDWGVLDRVREWWGEGCDCHTDKQQERYVSFMEEVWNERQRQQLWVLRNGHEEVYRYFSNIISYLRK